MGPKLAVALWAHFPMNGDTIALTIGCLLSDLQPAKDNDTVKRVRAESSGFLPVFEEALESKATSYAGAFSYDFWAVEAIVYKEKLGCPAHHQTNDC